MKTLNETVELMNSEDYKERFRAEYWQLKIRYEKLRSTLIKKEAGTLGFELTTPVYRLEEQQRHMAEYLHDLEVRAEIEGISLEE